MKFGVVIFPGSNCDHDCYYVIKNVLKQEVEFIWFKEHKIDSFDAIILPGGFSYGDYLRPGAIASYSPIIKSLRKFAENGGLIIGICNGFQILVESGLLPGALMRNRSLKFICKKVHIRVENSETPFTNLLDKGRILSLPIAHAHGCFYADSETINEIESEGLVVFRYCDSSGQITEESNPNGSCNNIAGIINKEGNVLGMMPHPERACEDIMGSRDGLLIFESMVNYHARNK